MRIKTAERGHLTSRPLYALVKVLSGFRIPDVVRTMRYRPAFFGAAQQAHTQAAMRGRSAWSVGERELFAAFVSRLNQCHF